MSMNETFLLNGLTSATPTPGVIVVGGFQKVSYVAGPGRRALVWVAGCRRRCPGCFQPQYFSFSEGEKVPVAEMAQRILAVPDLDGVTYSGGEPFEQAEALARLSTILRPKGLSIAAYSGYRIDALKADPQRFGSLLSQLDILIDGEYRDELRGPYKWRGSRNQRVHFLTTAEQNSPENGSPAQEIQLELVDDGIRLTGFPDEESQAALLAALEARGIDLKVTKP